MRFFLVFLLLLPSACRTTDSQPRKFADRMSDRSEAVNSDVFAPSETLTKDYFQHAYSNMSAEQFDAKWEGSLKSPLLFFRSYVNTWYDELKQMPFPGNIGPCLGDAHPENYGFVWFGGEDFRYLYNDVDDIAPCPVAFDALRYFTALKIWSSDDELVDQLRNYYISVLKGTNASADSVAGYKPKREALEKDVRDSLLEDGTFKIEGTISAIEEATKTSLYAALAPLIKGPWKDAVAVQIASGGSGGAERYYLLAEDPKLGLQVVEMKAMSEAATKRGDWSKVKNLPRTDILDQIWGKTRPTYFGFVAYGDKEFLVRSRLASFVNLEGLSKKDRLSVLQYQVYLLAELHRKSATKVDTLGSWLKLQTDYMAKRWTNAYRLNQKTR